jgi:hypothetical protein
MSLVLSSPLVIKQVVSSVVTGITITASSSPGTVVTTGAVFVGLDTLYVLLVGSVSIYNPLSSATAGTIQVFAGSNYMNLGVVTVPAGGYSQATVNYVFSQLQGMLPLGVNTIGLAIYGVSGLVVKVAEMSVITMGV